MVISWIIKNILNKKSFCVMFTLIAFCLVATEVAEAKTISNSTTFISENYLTYFDNLYKRSDYKYYLLSADNSDTYYYNYYLCLSNDTFDVTNALSAKSSCDVMYRYYRSSNSNYTLEKISDTELEVNNSVYYTSNIYDTNYVVNNFIVLIGIILTCFFMLFVLFRILG